MKVRVGQHHLYQWDPSQSDLDVTDIIKHENYSSITLANDICLLHLASEADFGKMQIGSIKLPAKDKEYRQNTPCVVTGKR